VVRLRTLLVLAALTAVGCTSTGPATPSGSPAGPSSASPVAVGPSVGPTASSNPTPSPAASASDAPSPSEAGWIQVVGEAQLAGDQPLGVVAFAGGMIAWGQGSAGLVTWTSTDGRAWDRAPDQPALEGSDLLIEGVSTFGGRFVAVGSDGVRGVALTSNDGRTWTRSPDQSAFKPTAGQAIRIHSVSGGPSGFVAVGGSHKIAGGYLQAIAPLTWTSADGRHWTRGPQIASTTGIVLNGVASGPSGWIAVGAPYNPPLTSAIFRSPDGHRWTREPGASSFKNAAILDVTYAGNQFVAGGIHFAAGAPSPAIWSSPDGLTWHYQTLSADSGQVFHVAPVGDGFAATGPSTETTGAWFSEDGRTWVADKPGAATAYEVAADDSLIVLVGLEGIWVKARR
jgi:hypothetical protein